MSDDYDLSTGPALRVLRKRFGWTQETLANLIHSNQSYVGQLERRQVVPPGIRERLREVFHAHKPKHAPATADELQRAFDAMQAAGVAFFETALSYRAGQPPRAEAPSYSPAPAAPPIADLDALLASAEEATPRAGRAYQRLTPEQKAANKVAQADEELRLKGIALRNQQRSEARAILGDIAMRLIFLAQDGNWTEYHEKRLAAGGNGNPFVDAFVAAAEKRVVELADPLVMLPDEPT